MAISIKPIETLYKGHRFRSRLEARWAVFFDHCGVKYVYEPEGFTLGDGYRYLPDFYLPEQDAYVEVKSVGAIKIRFDDDEVFFEDGREAAKKYSYFTFEACNNGHTVIIVQGDPYDALASAERGAIGQNNIFTLIDCFGCGKRHMSSWNLVGFLDNKIAICCNEEDILSGKIVGIPPNKDNFCMLVAKLNDNGEICGVDYVNVDEKSAQAGIINTMGGMISARQARFEFGEAGE